LSAVAAQQRRRTSALQSLVATSLALFLLASAGVIHFKFIAAVGVALVSALLLNSGVTKAQSSGSVTWTNLVNVTVSGTVLQKTGGCDGCDDAGATSEQQLSAGDGYVEFTVGETNTIWVAGLSHGNDGAGYADIDFAFRFNGAGYADVLESGVYQPGGDTTYVSGDVFRVGVAAGRVQYFKNGTLLRESAAAPQYPLLLDTSLLTVGATVRDAVLAASPPPPSGGGLLEKSGSPALRARFTRSQIDGFLPPVGAKGTFTFPAPYYTEGVRLTNAADCLGGQDCLWYVGYSYWRNINNHVTSADMFIFLGTDPYRGGYGPTLIRYNKVTNDIQNLGPLFDASSIYSYSTAEGWYFSAKQATKLYTFLPGWTQLRRYDILTRQFDPNPALDLLQCPVPHICPSNGAFITQPHSSDDDGVHSATVQDTDWRHIGCVVRQTPPGKYFYYPTPAGYALDECHVDKSGRWLMLLETLASGSRRNRIVDLKNQKVTSITDLNGALGHLDMGFGYAVGADPFNAMPNATILLKFPVASTQRPIGPVVHFNKRWDIAAANHVAHGNATATQPESQYVCGSNASRVADIADEIICFPLNAARNADGSLDVLVVGQVMTDLDAPGGQDLDGDDYEQLPKGNLDVTGRYFIWTTNLGGDRLDAFLVKVPAERLMGGQSTTNLRVRTRVR
jgi:hypothetical protein